MAYGQEKSTLGYLSAMVMSERWRNGLSGRIGEC